ncbi:NAD(P)H-dependent oxidoreductase [Aequorivita antarctica]|uniref:NAD(P)H-dependent oxidoreductase n=1 Tax=Aequorivita antarctica TaxID=153266 RepID=A0A5C6Z0M3_9FLAO|nr:NAD(P)H-dependent oxidoreductase [Aequorivita antarctica]TXD73578.1 NAD(P)H-dependent oxidoreductase [Aequorivita antarctica]SRX75018.1 Oxygen-insensitive NAD(P)H nitroreductase [Aequorivita antarctica]
MSSNTIEKLQWRYATKRFDSSKTLSEEKLDILKETFNLTATSYGLQPLKMVVVSNTDLKEQLMPLTYHQTQVRDASHVLILCVEKRINENFIVDHFKRVEGKRNTPRTILEPFEKALIENFSKKQAPEIRQWMANQLYLTLGALLTVCAVENIDACPIEGFEPKKYDQLLGLDEKGLESLIVLPVGYRDESDLFINFKKVRRGVEELIIEMN